MPYINRKDLEPLLQELHERAVACGNIADANRDDETLVTHNFYKGMCRGYVEAINMIRERFADKPEPERNTPCV